MKHSLKIFTYFFVISLCFVLVQMYLVGRGAVFGSEFEELDNKIEQIKEENQNLEKEIALESSLFKLSQNNDKFIFNDLLKFSNTKEEKEFEVALRP